MRRFPPSRSSALAILLLGVGCMGSPADQVAPLRVDGPPLEVAPVAAWAEAPAGCEGRLEAAFDFVRTEQADGLVGALDIDGELLCVDALEAVEVELVALGRPTEADELRGRYQLDGQGGEGGPPLARHISAGTPGGSDEASGDPTPQPNSDPEAAAGDPTPQPNSAPKAAAGDPTPQPNTDPAGDDGAAQDEGTSSRSAGDPTPQPNSDPESTGDPTPQPNSDPESAGDPTPQPNSDPASTGDPTPQPNSDPRAAGDPTPQPNSDPRAAGDPSRQPNSDPRGDCAHGSSTCEASSPGMTEMQALGGMTGPLR